MDALIPESADKSASTHVYIKYICLIMFTLQNVIRTALMRYTNIRPGPKYIGSTFIFICEIQKAILSIFLILCEERNVIGGFKRIIKIILTEPYNTIKICIIGLIYYIQNSLSLFAASNLDVAVYGVNKI